MTWWDRNVGGKKNWGHPSNHPQRLWLANFVKAGQRVLEVGYGTGQDYANLRDRGVVYRGYDMTGSFRDVCRTRWPDGDFRLADVAALPEADDSWDVVFCRHLLEHLQDWKAALAEMARVACGCLVIVSWRPLTDRESYQTDADVCAWVFNRAEWTGALEALGETETVEIDGTAPIYVLSKAEEWKK